MEGSEEQGCGGLIGLMVIMINSHLIILLHYCLCALYESF